ncbi:MAG: sulfatase-like hydrolase/transferase [Bacteroidales bacterium]|nr:sulfatase-like hydrolase/transferase [Bacteroidales bacterium]
MKKWLKNDLTTLMLRIGMLYVILFITQVLFYIYNQSSLGSISFSEGIRLFQGSLKFNTISILYLNGFYCILALLPFRFRAHKYYQKSLFWLFIISNSIGIIVLNLMDIEYFYFAHKRLTSEEFHFLNNNTNNIGVLWTVLKSRFELVIIGVLLIWGMVWTYRKIPYFKTDISKKILYYPICTVVFCISVYVMIMGIRGSFSHAVRPYTLSNAVYYCSSPQQANLILSNPFCVLRTLSNKTIEKPVFFSEDELLSIFSPNHRTSEFLYNLGKRNIVIFILESFSKEHSKFLCPEIFPDHPGFTPFLDSLMQEGYTFFNAFSNGRKSIEAMPSILASIPSYRTPFVLLPQSLGKMEALPFLLSNEGYHTAFFCGAEANSMGFEAIARLTGVQHLYTKEDYRSAGFPVNRNTNELWGIYDEPFFKYMNQVINKMPQPFFSTVFTLSSHHPYTLPENIKNQMPKGWTRVQPTVAYTDYSIRQFFENAKNETWFENTIFVFVADHASADIYSDEYRGPRGNSAIFQFIYTPDNALKGYTHQTSQQLDLMPTLLGLIGYEKPFFAFGRDVFNQPQRLPLATNFVGQTYQCITDSITIYFDGENVVSTYKNIRNPKQEAIAERHLKAILQTYYQRLYEKNYVYRSNERE